MADTSKDLSRNSLSFGTFGFWNGAFGIKSGQFDDHPCKKCWIKVKAGFGWCIIKESSPAGDTDFLIPQNVVMQLDVTNTNKLYYRVTGFTDQYLQVIYVE